MMLPKETIITKKVGQLVPTDLLQLILAGKPNAFGFAVQDGTGSVPELSIMRQGKPPTLEELKGFLDDSKDFTAMLYFAELGSKFNKDDVQPLILSDGDDKPFLAIGLDGDFSKYSNPAGGRTEAYNFASEILIPTLLEICEYAAGDLDKIKEKVNGDLFNKNILSHIGHRGSLTILTTEGDPIWLGKNELGEVYDWGQVSQRHGYGDVKQEPKAAEPVVEKKKGFSFGGAKASATPPALPKDVATAGDAPRTSVPETKTVGATTVVDTKGKHAPERPPSWVHKNSDLDMWYQVVMGRIPAEKKKRIPIIPTIDVLPQNLSELLGMRAEQMKTSMDTSTAVHNKPKIEAAKTETAAPVKTGTEVAAANAENNRPIINAMDMEKILNFVAKNLDSQSNEMMTVEQIQALEEKIGDFTASVGSTPFEALNWPVAGLFALAALDRRASVLLALEYRKLWRNTLKAEDLVGTSKPKDVVTTTVTKSGDTTKTESVVTPAPAPAVAKKGFSFRKVA